MTYDFIIIHLYIMDILSKPIEAETIQWTLIGELFHLYVCVSFFSTVAIKYQDHGYLQKKVYLEAYNLQGIESMSIMAVSMATSRQACLRSYILIHKLAGIH